jgi:hypothetical protein
LYNTQCGNQLTLEEILQDNVHYPTFSTHQDVEETCAEMEASYGCTRLVAGEPLGMPSTMELCRRQIQIKHLCDGYCEGVFFIPTIYPPSCEAYNGAYENASQIDILDTCIDLQYHAFHFIEDPFNISSHSEYFQVLSDPSGSSKCEEYRVAYPHCYWCAEEQCFTPERTATCNASTTDGTLFGPALLNGTEVDDVNEICWQICWQLEDLGAGSPGISSISPFTPIRCCMGPILRFVSKPIRYTINIIGVFLSLLHRKDFAALDPGVTRML